MEDCLARGYERTGFFEVDTMNRTDWMLQLTDDGTSSAGALGDATEGAAGDAPITTEGSDSQ